MSELFLDTSYALALIAKTDRHHSRAMDLFRQVQRRGIRLVTTRAVMLEIGNSLSKSRRRAEAIGLLKSLEADPSVEILPLSEDLFLRGFDLFRQRCDKDWGLVDCVSFVVMRDRRLRDCLTTDRHFKQAGFQALLLEA
jgi:predicted nucleic acid-binding protein